MSLDASIISLVTRNPSTFVLWQQAGVEPDDFEDDWQKVWRWIARMRTRHGSVPSPEAVQQRYGWVEIAPVRKKDMPILLDDLKKRRQHTRYIEALMEAVDGTKDFDDVADSIQALQGRLNEIASSNGAASIRDLFSKEVSEEVVNEIRKRRSGQQVGWPTGLHRFDAMTGGLHKGRLYTVMGRQGLGKSWLDLLFVANAVVAGAKFTLYPLEMTLPETAFRLYTLFTQRCFGAERVLKNFDLSSGHISPKKVVRFLNALEDKFAGQLYVADMANVSDPYTPERVEAETEILRPDGFWVDYISLMKTPRDYGEKGYMAIEYLSRGMKGAAQRQRCVGGISAQVNREALKSNVFIPRLEHISHGDSIGADSDGVVSINRKGKYLFYALVKNRHGPEFGRTRAKFFVNEGIIVDDQQSEDNDE